MNKLKFPVVLSALLIAVTPVARAGASAVVRNHTLILNYTDIRAGACSVSDPEVGVISSLTPLDSVLYNRNGMMVFCDPVVAPDGHQLTLGEFKAARVRSWQRCTGECSKPGTHTVLHFTGLVPKGTYTVWLFVKNGAGAVTAVGALGTTMPIENSFTANEAGEGRLSVITPAENLSANMGPVDSCFLDSPFELHLVYHIDGNTYGPVPGPEQTWITVGMMLFP
jgi:hypothetical protein